jgi:hypothetical protein
MRDASLLDQYLPLVLKDSGESLPVGVFTMRQRLESALYSSVPSIVVEASGNERLPGYMVEAIYENRAEGGQDYFKAGVSNAPNPQLSSGKVGRTRHRLCLTPGGVPVTLVSAGEISLSGGGGFFYARRFRRPNEILRTNV